MNIISLIFVVFICIVYISLTINNKIVKNLETRIKNSNIILLIASYVFIGYVSLKFAFILFLVSIFTWVGGNKNKYMKLSIICCILILAYFKYSNFFIENIYMILNMHNSPVLNIALPLGISFYIFSAISYIIDTNRKKNNSQSFLYVNLYLAFFPKLTCGPIQSSTDFFAQINKEKIINWENFSIGLQIFCFGLFKKMVLADRLGVFVDQVYSTPNIFNRITIILAVISYSFQIYFDFSGYSDMAIGIAKTLGINLPINFNLPYLSMNVTEFWKRWHITLSSWLQQYVYFSLGGNRKGKKRTYLNLIITMLIGGLWHGANWTYIIWGLFHGFGLAIHKYYIGKVKSGNILLVNKILSIGLTFIFVTFCWIFFRAESCSKAIEIIYLAVADHKGIYHPYLWIWIALIIYFLAVIFAYKHSRLTNIIQGYYPILCLNKFWNLVIFFIFCGLIIGLGYAGSSPFIYGAY